MAAPRRNKLVAYLIQFAWWAVMLPYAIMLSLIQMLVLIPLSWIAPLLAYKINCFFAWLGITMLLNKFIIRFGRLKFVFSGDCDESGNIGKQETAIMIANHRTLVDWLAFFALGVATGGMNAYTRIFIKAGVKWIPGIGTGLSNLGYLFVRRSWAKDQDYVTKQLRHLNRFENAVHHWIAIFPEGTRLTPEKLREAQEFAKSRGLPIFKHLQMPRTKGFIATLKNIDNVGAIYDVTLGFEGTSENPVKPDLFKLISANEDATIHVHVRRIDRSEFMKQFAEIQQQQQQQNSSGGDKKKSITLTSPKDVDDKTIEKWLLNIFHEKDKLLDEFYRNGNKFPATATGSSKAKKTQ